MVRTCARACASNTRSSFPFVVASQPSGLNAIRGKSPSWPRSSVISAPLAASQTFTTAALSSIAAMSLPSREIVAR
jgi:hypothetical protein